MSESNDSQRLAGDSGGGSPTGPTVPPRLPPVRVPPPPSLSPLPGPGGPRRGSSAWKTVLMVFALVLLAGSVALNVVLALVIRAEFISTARLSATVLRSGAADQEVAVLDIKGTIGPTQVMMVDTFCRQMAERKQVKAVLLRVDSPGGAVGACDQIYKLLSDFKAHTGKKLVVSMGSVAASGGYYISVVADAIYAEPTTITGSIGVLSAWPVLKGTMEKLGIEWVIVRSSGTQAWKAARNPFEKPTAYQIAELQALIDKIHKRFEDIVTRERGGKVRTTTVTRTYNLPGGGNLTVEETEPFNGRIFLADRAVQLGLVDRVGYFDDAIRAAARLAGLTRPKVVAYRLRRNIFEQIGLSDLSDVKAFSLKSLEELQSPRVMMLWRVGN